MIDSCPQPHTVSCSDWGVVTSTKGISWKASSLWLKLRPTKMKPPCQRWRKGENHIFSLNNDDRPFERYWLRRSSEKTAQGLPNTSSSAQGLAPAAWKMFGFYMPFPARHDRNPLQKKVQKCHKKGLKWKPFNYVQLMTNICPNCFRQYIW